MSAVSSNGPIRAAAYLRMSSENQRYSTENQQNAIAEYAQQHGYSIVTSYIDAGKRAFSLKSRDCAQSNFSATRSLRSVLLTPFWCSMSVGGDGSKTPNQSRHTSSSVGSRSAGHYCAEPFGEDVAPITTIISI